MEFNTTTMLPMRKWLSILLLIVVPLQFTWAASSVYCLHEVGVAAQHPGHHGHQHVKQAGELVQVDNPKSIAIDLDCGNCHTGWSIGLASLSAPELLLSVSGVESSPEHALVSPPLKTPDRPQWPPRS